MTYWFVPVPALRGRAVLLRAAQRRRGARGIPVDGRADAHRKGRRGRSAGLPLQLPGDLRGYHDGPLHHREGDAAVGSLHFQEGADIETEAAQPAAAQPDVRHKLVAAVVLAGGIHQRTHAVGARWPDGGLAPGALDDGRLGDGQLYE